MDWDYWFNHSLEQGCDTEFVTAPRYYRQPAKHEREGWIHAYRRRVNMSVPPTYMQTLDGKALDQLSADKLSFGVPVVHRTQELLSSASDGGH